MSFTRFVSEITLGGNGSDNPVPLNANNYQLSPAEQQLILTNQNVIVPDKNGDLQVTALAIVDPVTHRPKLTPADIVFCPCPPICT